jgi:hypothetical protein
MAQKQKAKATPAEVLAISCPTCKATPDEPCNVSQYPAFGLGMCLEGFSGAGIHASRYLAKVRARTESKP